MKKKLLIIIGILSIFIVGCMIVFFVNKNELKDTYWRLDGWYLTSKSLDKNNIFIIFRKDKVTGISGVNSYGGDYEVKAKKKLIIKNIFNTEMASEDPEINDVESTYLNLLTEVKYYELNDNKLILYNEDHNEILIFTK